MAKNKVIAGDYEGKSIMVQTSWLGKKQVILSTGFTKNFPLNKDTVLSYETITEEHRKSAVSGVARGLVGSAFLGPVGMLAGGLSAKNKQTQVVAIEFKDGKKSLLEINGKIYKTLIESLF